MRAIRKWSPAVLCLSGLACADLPTSVARPVPGAPARYETAWVNGREYPVFDSEEDARANLGWADIHNMRPIVFWEGNTAIGLSELSYMGNHGSQRLRLTARNAKGSASEDVFADDEHLWPTNREFWAPSFRVSLLGTQGCGGLATLTGSYTAEVVLLIKHKYLPTVLSSKSSYDTSSDRQPECPPEPCPSAGPAAAEGDGLNCYRDEDEPWSGSGGGGTCPECVEEPAQPTYCRVRYWYWKDTEEIFQWSVLWCA